MGGREAQEPRPVSGRLPPHDLDAEAAVLSAALLDGGALDVVLEALSPEHFYSDAHRVVMAAMRDVSLSGGAVDVVTVAGRLREREQIERAGGPGYLGVLVDATPAVANVAEHAAVVRDRARARRLIATCQRLAAEGYGDVGPVGEWLEGAEAEIVRVVRQDERRVAELAGETLRRVMDELIAAAQQGRTIVGRSWGLVDVDRLTAGLHGGEVVTLAARPGMGKTALALAVAQHVAEQASVAVYSLEMSREQLVTRMLCSRAGVDLGRLRHGTASRSDWQHMTAAGSQLARLPIWIDDTASLTLAGLRAKARRLAADREREDNPLGLVVVDYLQLMGGAGVRGQSREQEIGEISRGLKQLAKDLNVPVLSLAQLNREVEKRGRNKRPLLSDLRESGSIEQDSDTVMFLYRDEYYDRETDLRGIAELIVAKQRNGPTGTVRLRFIPSCTRFDNLAGEEGWQDDVSAPDPYPSTPSGENAS